jgi:hypothetical protein
VFFFRGHDLPGRPNVRFGRLSFPVHAWAGQLLALSELAFPRVSFRRCQGQRSEIDVLSSGWSFYTMPMNKINAPYKKLLSAGGHNGATFSQ